MQLSVVHNLILMGCSDDIPVSGLLVIDAVRWRSMYFIVMPRVNRIVIFLTYHIYLYSINCPTIIYLPSMCYFILWRDTTSELWTLVLFPSYCYRMFTLLALFTLLAYFHCFPLDTLIPFVSSKPVRLTTSSYVGNKVFGCVVCRFHIAASKQSLDDAPYKLSWAIAS
jgi:hypothetical protein